MPQYYKVRKDDVEFDNVIRKTIKDTNSKSNMAFFLQGQEELNLLRRLIDNQKDMVDDIETIANLLNRRDEIQDEYDITLAAVDFYMLVEEGIKSLNARMDDLLEYICESTEKGCFSKKEPDRLKEDALSMVKMHNSRAKYLYDKDPTKENRYKTLVWDYILCCVAND